MRGGIKSDPPWTGANEPEHITRIRVLFTRLLPGRVRKISQNLEKLFEDSSHEEKYRTSRNLFLEAHRLSGSAGSFGGDRIGDVAGKIDETLRRHYDDGTIPPPYVISTLLPLLDELKDAEKEFLLWMEGVEMSSDWIDDDQDNPEPLRGGEVAG